LVICTGLVAGWLLHCTPALDPAVWLDFVVGLNVVGQLRITRLLRLPVGNDGSSWLVAGLLRLTLHIRDPTAGYLPVVAPVVGLDALWLYLVGSALGLVHLVPTPAVDLHLTPVGRWLVPRLTTHLGSIWLLVKVYGYCPVGFPWLAVFGCTRYPLAVVIGSGYGSQFLTHLVAHICLNIYLVAVVGSFGCIYTPFQLLPVGSRFTLFGCYFTAVTR